MKLNKKLNKPLAILLSASMALQFIPSYVFATTIEDIEKIGQETNNIETFTYDENGNLICSECKLIEHSAGCVNYQQVDLEKQLCECSLLENIHEQECEFYKQLPSDKIDEDTVELVDNNFGVLLESEIVDADAQMTSHSASRAEQPVMLMNVAAPIAEETSVLEWSGTQSGGALKTDVILVGDTYMTSLITIASGVSITIDLNGYMLCGSGDGSVISNKGTLTIIDSRPTEGSHRFTKSTTGPWLLDENGDVEIIGGIVTGGRDKTALSSGSSGGGAVKQGANTTANVLYIEGGTFVGNSSTRAGGAFYGGAVTMNGGSVIGNYADGFAGGISLSGSFVFNDGLIEQNETSVDSSYNVSASARFYDNANVIIGQKSSFIMTGGTLNGNLATVTSTTGSPSFTMTGGAVNGNFRILNGLTAELSGGTLNGSVYMKKGKCVVSDNAQIYGGYGSNGGAICMDGGNFEMKGGVIRNSSATNGGAVYVNNGSVTMSGGSIYDCEATADGGAVYINTGSFKMTGGEMHDNSAVNGGSVYVNGGSFTLDGGKFYNNDATDGGAAYVTGGNFTMNDGEFDNNNAVNNGGAIYVNTNSVDVDINVYDGKITNNTAGNHGGAIGANAENEYSVTLNVGLEECKGANMSLHEDNNCPEILNNTASRLGGAFCLHGNKERLAVNIYCGQVTGNIAIRNPGSNSLNQGGGTVTVWGGTIDPGIMVGGGSYEDNRINADQIYLRFWSNYEGGVTEPQLVEVTAGITVTFPVDTYIRDGHELSGWATAPDATGLYIPANGQYAIQPDDDNYLDFYAAWDVESTYIVYIPDEITIDKNKTGEMEIAADINYFKANSNLNIFANCDFQLSSVDDETSKLLYQVISSEFGEYHIINPGDIVATFQYNNILKKKIKAKVLETQTSEKVYSGLYSDVITFTVEYEELEED